MGDAPPAVLRPLVPVPASSGRPATAACRSLASIPTTPASGRRGPISEMNDARPRHLHRLDRRAGRRRPRPARQGASPTTRPPASGPSRTTAAGSRRSTRDNVELVRDDIERIEPDGVVDRRRPAPPGRRHRLRHRLPRQPVPVADGDRRAATARRWPSTGATSPSAYLGITVPDFPNLFCMYGPGTNLANGGSLIFHSECQMRYISGCLQALIATAGTPPSSRARTVHDAYSRPASRPSWTSMVWSHPSIRPLLVQDRRRPHLRPLPVAPRRLLGLDPGARPRGLRDPLTRLRSGVPPATLVSTRVLQNGVVAPDNVRFLVSRGDT